MPNPTGPQERIRLGRPARQQPGQRRRQLRQQQQPAPRLCPQIVPPAATIHSAWPRGPGEVRLVLGLRGRPGGRVRCHDGPLSHDRLIRLRRRRDTGASSGRRCRCCCRFGGQGSAVGARPCRLRGRRVGRGAAGQVQRGQRRREEQPGQQLVLRAGLG